MPRLERAPHHRLTQLAHLQQGEIEILGRLPYSSNYAFLARLHHEGDEVVAVYKPRQGERPLWDFPGGTLAAREAAAYLVSEAAGWNLVPPTVLREDGPAGPGSFQLFIDHDPNRHFFVLLHEGRDRDAFRHFAAFDAAINNADRKAGHVLEDPDGRLWGVDQALSFNVEPKLRTVIWAFAGERIPALVRGRLETLQAALAPGGSLEDSLQSLLDGAEIAETRARVELLLRRGTFPEPSGPYAMPWPLV